MWLPTPQRALVHAQTQPRQNPALVGTPPGALTWGRTGLVTILPLVITRRFRPATSIPPYRASRGDDGRATMMSRGSLIPLGRSNLRQKLPRPPHVVPVALSEPRFGCEEHFFEARPFVCHRDAGNETHDENDVYEQEGGSQVDHQPSRVRRMSDARIGSSGHQLVFLANHDFHSHVLSEDPTAPEEEKCTGYANEHGSPLQVFPAAKRKVERSPVDPLRYDPSNAIEDQVQQAQEQPHPAENKAGGPRRLHRAQLMLLPSEESEEQD